MDTVRRLRAMASLCRQTAAYHPDRRWKLLAEAEYWEHLADHELAEHFKKCTGNSTGPQQLASANVNDVPASTVAAA